MWRRAWSAWIARIRWQRPRPAARARQAALLALVVPLALAPAGDRRVPGASTLATQAAVGQAWADGIVAYAVTDTGSSATSGLGSASAGQPAPAASPEPDAAFAAALSATGPAVSTTPAGAAATPIPSAAARRSTARRNAVATPAPLKWRTAIASFYDWNTWGFDAPGGLRGHMACGTRYTRDLVAVAAPPGMFACGTKIAFRVAGSSKVVVAPVLDSGYFSVLDSRRMWDLTSQACLMLRHCYTGTIEWAFWSGN